LLCWGYVVTFTKLLHYIILEFTPSIILLYPPLPIPRIVSPGLIFPLTHMSTECLHHIHPPIPFPYILSPPTGTNPRQDLFCLSIYVFVLKNDIFCLFKIQGLSLCHFHVYMYCNPKWFISSIFLLSILVPFLL
jgi:hypothetical protein